MSNCCWMLSFQVLRSITALGTRTACRVPGLRPPDTCHDPTMIRPLIHGKLPSHSQRFFPCFSMLQGILPSTRPFPQLGLLYSPSTWSNRPFSSESPVSKAAKHSQTMPNVSLCRVFRGCRRLEEHGFSLRHSIGVVSVPFSSHSRTEITEGKTASSGNQPADFLRHHEAFGGLNSWCPFQVMKLKNDRTASLNWQL